MLTRRLAARLHVLALLALLAAGAVQAFEAQLSILWRASVLSWDDPATQVQDELASQGAASTDLARHAREAGRAGLRPAGRLAAPGGPARPAHPAVASWLTRSPPAA